MLEVVERAIPAPGPGEALVRVRAATVNPTDTLFRSGAQAFRLSAFEPPYTPGMDLAGEILSFHAGGEVADGFRIGDRVAAVVPPWRESGGAQARFVTADTRSLFRILEGLSFVEVATLPMNSLTALMALEEMELDESSTVLVAGGAGALGGYTISIAAHRGHTVIADGKESDRGLLAELGASTVVPRGERLLDELARVAPEGVDGILDAARLGEGVAPALRPNRVLVQVRPDSPPAYGDAVRAVKVSVPTQIFNAAKIREVARLAAEGVLTPRVARVLEPSQVAEAHHQLAVGGLRGRLVLAMS